MKLDSSPLAWFFLPLVLAAWGASPALAQLGEQAEPGDHLGAALASGDFDGDGLADLVIGVPGESVEARTLSGTTVYPGAGAVHLVYAKAGEPLGSNRILYLHEAVTTTSTLPRIAPFDAFGTALAVGDFDGDGIDDLAVGAPGTGVSHAAGAGAVYVFRGSRKGLRTIVAWTQDSTGIADVAEAGDGFGMSLAVGDVNGDGIDDLAVGVPFEDLPGALDAGGVLLLRGSSTGLVAKGSQWIVQSASLSETPETGDHFALALALGDLDGDGFGELAIGVPDEGLAGQAAVGVVHVLPGSAKGSLAIGARLWSQDAPDVEGDGEGNDRFGAALAIADLDRDGFGDLAIGVPHDAVAGVHAGGVEVLFGSPIGETAVQDLLVTQADPVVGGTPQEGDLFGTALTTWRQGPFTELLIGVPGESEGAALHAGAVEAVGVSPFGVGSSLFHTPLVPGQKSEAYGSAVATGDFDGNGEDDFAIGTPLHDFAVASDCGAVEVDYSSQLFFSELHQTL